MHEEVASPPHRGLLSDWCGEQTIHGNGRSDGDGEEGDPLNVENQRFPSDGWEVFLFGNGSRDIVVRNLLVVCSKGRLDGVYPRECVDATLIDGFGIWGCWWRECRVVLICHVLSSVQQLFTRHGGRHGDRRG